MEKCPQCSTENNYKEDNSYETLSHDMVYVEGGNIQLGDDELYDNPKHIVTLDSFYISKYQVTQKLWNSVMSYDHSEFIGSNRPVDSVNWYDAVVFCNELSKKEGLTPCYTIDKNNLDSNNQNENDNLKWTVKCNFMANGYRLPTEAEWEYAAKGGQKSKDNIYSGSNNIDHVAWFDGNSNNETHEVGQKKSIELGLYDMSGNVWEWCWGWYSEDVKSGINPTGAACGLYRELRGGSWYDGDYCCEVSYRSRDNPIRRSCDCGLRIVRSRF